MEAADTDLTPPGSPVYWPPYNGESWALPFPTSPEST